jgi:hypothetical protein
MYRRAAAAVEAEVTAVEALEVVVATAVALEAATLAVVASGGGFRGGGYGYGGYYGGYGYGYGYPYGYGGYDDDEGGCYLVRQRVRTRHGYQIRRVEVCR